MHLTSSSLRSVGRATAAPLTVLTSLVETIRRLRPMTAVITPASVQPTQSEAHDDESFGFTHKEPRVSMDCCNRGGHRVNRPHRCYLGLLRHNPQCWSARASRCSRSHGNPRGRPPGRPGPGGRHVCCRGRRHVRRAWRNMSSLWDLRRHLAQHDLQVSVPMQVLGASSKPAGPSWHQLSLHGRPNQRLDLARPRPGRRRTHISGEVCGGGRRPRRSTAIR